MSFRRRRVIVAVAPVGAWLALGSRFGEASDHRVLDWRNARIAGSSRLELTYPCGWYATSNDGRDVVVSSFPVSRDWLAAGRRSVPNGGVYIWAFSYGPLPNADNGLFPPRPARLELDPKTFGFYACALRLDGYMLRFRDHGLAVQVEVALGRGADERAAIAVINRLRVS